MKNYINILSFLFVNLFLGLEISAQEMTIFSPDRRIEVSLFSPDKTKGIWALRVKYGKNGEYLDAIPHIQIGLKANGVSIYDGLRLVKKNKAQLIGQGYLASHGKSLKRQSQAMESMASFINSSGQKMNLIFRAYNDGISFRYLIPGPRKKKLVISQEMTSYEFRANADRWLQKFVTSYEGFYTRQSDGIKNGEWGYPALFRTSNADAEVWMLVSEAGLDSTYCATKLGNKEDGNIYKTLFPAETDGNSTGAVKPSITLPWSSPWRSVIMGSLSDLVESTLVEDLSMPSKIRETDWIKPGVSSWIYWANNHGTKDYKKIIDYIDLAARMNWPYTLFDWEWDTMSNGGNLEDAVRYAAKKGIKPMMWYNSGGAHNRVSSTPRDRMITHESRLKEFAWLNKIGVYGIKIDFFESDKQDMIKYYIDILEDAAKFKLMVNFHGSTVPRGWSRTYPNLMTMEAVFGGEQYNNGLEMSQSGASHNATLPFTRNVIGPMDYTPVSFTNSQHVHSTTYAHELALSVIFESAIQHMADRPQGYDNLPDAPKMFLCNVPVIWDETKFVEGFPGKSVVLARRRGSKWYLAGINGEDKNISKTIGLNFLEKDKDYKVTFISDGDYDTAFDTQYLTKKKGDNLDCELLARGGFVAVFSTL